MRAPFVLGFAVWAVILPAAVVAQPAEGLSKSTRPDSPFVTTNSAIRTSLERIARGSARWREAGDALRAAGRQVVVLTSDQVVVTTSPDNPDVDRFDPTVLAEAAPVINSDASVDVVVVVVNLTLLEDVHRRQESLPAELDSDLDRILIHEIYGHAIPYLHAGGLSGRCPDPLPGEAAANACSIRRENLIRAELRLGRRIDYGLSGLLLARPDRH